MTLTPRTLERPPDRCSSSPDTRVVDCKWVYVLKGPCARCGDMTSAGACADDVLMHAGKSNDAQYEDDDSDGDNDGSMPDLSVSDNSDTEDDDDIPDLELVPFEDEVVAAAA